MTFVALFTSWQFWLVNAVLCFVSYWAGFGTLALFAINEDEGPCNRLHADEYGVELIALRTEGQRLQERIDALQVMNDDMQDQLGELDNADGVDPDSLLPELLRNVPEHKPGPEQAV